MSATLDAVEAIVDAVAAAVGGQAGIPADVLRSASRVPAVMRARDLMMRILHTDFLCTVDAVGLAMGCDRTTVSFGERRAEGRLCADPALAARIRALVRDLQAAGVTPPPQSLGVVATWAQLRISFTKRALHAIGVQLGDRVDATPLDDRLRRLRIRRGERHQVARVGGGMPGVNLTLPPQLRIAGAFSLPATWSPIVGGGIDIEIHRDLLADRDTPLPDPLDTPLDAPAEAAVEAREAALGSAAPLSIDGLERWASYAGHDCPRAVAQCTTDLRRTFGSVAG